VGTELLLGQIVNTNAQYLSRELAGLGIDVYFQTVVGDNDKRLTEALEIAQNRADLVICTGGLGPTQDDLTKDVLAAYTSKRLMMHQPSMDKIQAYYDERGTEMVESNARQALMIEDAVPLFNDVGMAVGLAMKYKDTFFILLPGPPREMKVMFENHTKAWLMAELNDEIPLYSKILKFAGIGESSLEFQLSDLIKVQTDPTIAPYAKEGEVTIRLTTRAHHAEEAESRMADTENTIRSLLGEYIYADADISIEQAIVQIMAANRITLSAAESCTGGMLSDLITSVPGSSAVYKGGIICYSNEVKHKILNVPLDLLEGAGAPGAVSSETAVQLADNLLALTGTNYAVSITGIAGPDEVGGKPSGLVYIALAQQGEPTTVSEVKFGGNRELIKLKACKYALYMVWQSLKQ
jgi:nicotinamide-nucleotide amidase